MELFRPLLVIIIIFSGWNALFAQACCSGGVPISGNLGLASSTPGELQLQLTYDHNTLRDLLTVSELLNDRSRTRKTLSLMLEGSYDISGRLSVSALIPFVRQERIIRTLAGSEDFTANNGLGDIIFLLRYNLLTRGEYPDQQLTLGAGPKFPTGRSDFTDSRGIILPADLQPGTGAWDGILWINYTYGDLFGRKNLSFHTTGTARLTTTNQRFNNRQAYKFGNEFQIQAGFQDQFLLGKLLIDPMLILRYRAVGSDRVDGNIFNNTGGHWVYLRPGININPTPGTAIRFMADLPVYRRLTGTQLTTSYKLVFSVYRSFSLKKSSPVKQIMPGG